MGKMTQFCLHLSITGFLVVFIVLLAMNHDFPLQPRVVSKPPDGTGWPSGVSWMLGITNALYAYGATDAVIHIAEEMSSPGKRVPQVL